MKFKRNRLSLTRDFKILKINYFPMQVMTYLLQDDNSSNTDTAQGSTTNKTSTPQNSQHDHKFNVVIYGIDECDKDTPRNERSGHDLSSVTQIITKVDVPYLQRLGKYQNPSRHPRPSLIRRAIDVSLFYPKQFPYSSGI